MSASSAPIDFFTTKVGDFWSYADPQFWDEKMALSEGQVPKAKLNIDKYWPRDYMIKRMELVSALWRVADTNLGWYILDFLYMSV